VLKTQTSHQERREEIPKQLAGANVNLLLAKKHPLQLAAGKTVDCDNSVLILFKRSICCLSSIIWLRDTSIVLSRSCANLCARNATGPWAARRSIMFFCRSIRIFAWASGLSPEPARRPSQPLFSRPADRTGHPPSGTRSLRSHPRCSRVH
jgi:hypothetical protein